MSNIFFDEVITIRVTKKQLKDLKAIHRHNKDRYSSVGHIIRAGINTMIRQHKGGF